MIVTFEELQRFTRALARLHVWKVPVRIGSRDSHISVDEVSAEKALERAKRWAHLSPWTIVEGGAVEVHPNFRHDGTSGCDVCNPPAFPEEQHVGPVNEAELEQLEQLAGDVAGDVAQHNVSALEPEHTDDRAVPLTRKEGSTDA